MNKSNLIKRYIISVLVLLYDIVSLFWCYIFIESIIFSFSDIKIGAIGLDYTVYIIGGTNTPTLGFQAANFMRGILPILFIPLSFATAFLLTVSIFNKQTDRKMNVLPCIFSAIPLIVFLLIPQQTYILSLYKLMREIAIIQHALIFYILISLVIIVINILFAIKRSNK